MILIFLLNSYYISSNPRYWHLVSVAFQCSDCCLRRSDSTAQEIFVACSYQLLYSAATAIFSAIHKTLVLELYIH